MSVGGVNVRPLIGQKVCQWAGLTGVEGAAGTLRRVKHAAYICGAGGGGGRGRSQGGAGGIGGGDSPSLGLAIRDAAIADLPGLVLQRRWVSHGARPRRGRTDPRRLQRTGVLLHLEEEEEEEGQQVSHLCPRPNVTEKLSSSNSRMKPTTNMNSQTAVRSIEQLITSSDTNCCTFKVGVVWGDV